MGWIHKLYKTYENCLPYVGKISETEKVPLLPIAHILQQVQLEITIDQTGKFIRANPVLNSEASTVIPCTEASAGRSGSSPESHPLCEKLQYVAKDICEFIDSVTEKDKEKYRKLNNKYLNILSKWCESKYSHAKVKAVLNYIKKGTVTKDLISSGVIKIDANGKIKKKYSNSVIRWRVYIKDDLEDRVWADKSLFDSWSKYDAEIQGEIGLCYVAGKNMRLTKNHPKYIRNTSDSSKIISSNDNTGFTYRGRFSNVEQAYGLSYEVTQKAHNALRWIIGKQGKVFYEGKDKKPGLTIVAWTTQNNKLPNPLADVFDIMEFEKIQYVDDVPVYTAQELAVKLNKKICGYGTEIGDTTDVMVLCLDSVTPGRLSIVYYRELKGSDFLERIENWHKTCCWLHEYRKISPVDLETGKNKKLYLKFIGAPSPIDIAKAAYGKKVGENGAEKFEVDDKLKKSTIQRIIPCIIDGRKIPKDLVESTVRRASNRVGIGNEEEWNKTLSIACALYKKYHERENIDMALDKTRTRREYLYGRLLALADNLEQWALYDAGENRQTNAARLMQRFADHPFSTWRSIELALEPYKKRLGNRAVELQQLITEVTSMFDIGDFTNDKKLDGEFLLGFHCQREELKNMIIEKQKQKDKKSVDNSSSEGQGN